MISGLFTRARRSAMAYGAVGVVVRVGANFLLLPIVLSRLSTQEMALWWIFLACGQAANLVDFGFGQSLSRAYAYLYGGADDFDTEGLGPPPEHRNPNVARLRVLETTAHWLYLRLSLAAVGLTALIGTFFVWRHAEVAGGWSVWACWGLYVVAVGYGLVTTHWNVACTGVNKVKELQMANLYSGLVYLGSATALLYCRGGLYAMVLATLLRAAVARWICARAFTAVVPRQSPGPAVDRLMLRKLWPNAWKFGVLSLGVFLIYQANVLVCSHFLGDAATASFGLTAQIGAFLTNFSGLWLTVKWPAITVMRVQGRSRELSVLFAQRLTLVMLTYVAGAAAVILFGNPLLEWKGTHTRLLGVPMLAVYFFYLGQQHFYAQFGSLTFTENVVPFFKLSLFTGLAVFVLSVVLTSAFGLWGLIVGPLTATMAVCTWYVPWRGFQGQPLSVGEFCRAALFRPV